MGRNTLDWPVRKGLSGEVAFSANGWKGKGVKCVMLRGKWGRSCTASKVATGLVYSWRARDGRASSGAQ